MIDVQQLRIGNYVTTIRNDEMQQVDYIKQEQVKDGFYSSVRTNKCSDYFLPEHIFPIPLTEDILLKCGFEKTLSEGVYSVMDEDIYLKRNKEGWEYQICISSNDGEFIILACIKFLHEVQNLFTRSIKKNYK